MVTIIGIQKAHIFSPAQIERPLSAKAGAYILGIAQKGDAVLMAFTSARKHVNALATIINHKQLPVPKGLVKD